MKPGAPEYFVNPIKMCTILAKGEFHDNCNKISKESKERRRSNIFEYLCVAKAG